MKPKMEVAFFVNQTFSGKTSDLKVLPASIHTSAFVKNQISVFGKSLFVVKVGGWN
jgi:hypothetical protein